MAKQFRVILTMDVEAKNETHAVLRLAKAINEGIEDGAISFIEEGGKLEVYQIANRALS